MVELIGVSFCSLLFVAHFYLHRLTNDDTNQYLVLLLFVFYTMTVVFDFTISPDRLASLPALILIRHFFVIGSIFSAVVYVTSLFKDAAFSKITLAIRGSLVLEFILLIIAVLGGYSQFPVMLAVIASAVFSIAVYIGFLILRRNVLPAWNKMLLLSMLFTVICFSLMECLNIFGFQHKAFFMIGIIAYMLVYEVMSFSKIFGLLSARTPKKAAVVKSDENPFALTKTELEIVGIMREGLFSSKDIAVRLNKNPDTVHKHIKNIMAKVGCSDRKQIVDIIDDAVGGVDDTVAGTAEAT